MEIFKTGQEITIEMDGRQVDATVKFASRNGISLMVTFDALLGGYAGMMPLLYDVRTQVFKDLIQWKDVKVTSRI